MKTRYLVALTLATAVLAPSIAGAQEQWAYTGFQPWYWLDDSQRWVYVPDQPQFVWSPDANDWIPNPMAAETFDIAENMDQSSLSFELLRTDAELLRVTVNLSGTESGVLGLGEAQIPLEYRYRVNAISGTVELFAKLVGEEQEGAFPSTCASPR
jgi:hypothetical protein